MPSNLYIRTLRSIYTLSSIYTLWSIYTKGSVKIRLPVTPWRLPSFFCLNSC
jgi:hypothetical protein